MVSCEEVSVRSQWNLTWLKKKKHSLGTPAFKEYSLENKDQITDTNSDWITKD
jgi:hypothetical protein